MHPVRRQRLFLVLFIVIVASAAVALMIASLGSNLNLFFPPSKIVAGEAPIGVRIRAGGMVVKGSVERDPGSLSVRFRLTDGPAQIEVHYSGILPDLFDEGEAAVAAGMLDQQGVFQADEVLAKHDENYTPPEVVEAMKAGHEYRDKEYRDKQKTSEPKP